MSLLPCAPTPTSHGNLPLARPRTRFDLARLSLSSVLLLGACSARLFPETDDAGDGANAGDAGPGDGRGGGGGNCGDGDGPGTEPPPSCENYTVEVQAAQADVLVVLDRSGSMRDLTVNRWDPSVSAVEELTKQLAPTLRLGLMTFPGDCGSLPTPAEQVDCLARQGTLLGDLTCEPGQVKVAPDFGTAAAISTQLRSIVPTGATPTAATLRAAHEALKGMASPTTTQTVLLVTDGAPNCAAGNVGGLGSVGVGTSASGQPQAVPQTVSAIEAMTKDGIKTYVLGYDTQRDPALKGALDLMAQAGGTGDQVHHAVESHATLRDTLTKLTGRTADCEFVLKSRVVDPWTVRVTLDGKVLTVDDVNGFKLDAAGDNLTVLGTSCDSLNDGARHVLGVDAICPEPVPVPDAGVDAGDDEPDAAIEEPDAGSDDPDAPPLLWGKTTVCPPADQPGEPLDAGAPPPPPAPPVLQ